MQAAIGSFFLLFLCAARLLLGPANSPWLWIDGHSDGLADCLVITLLVSGVVTLFHSDEVSYSLWVIFLQLVFAPLIFETVNALEGPMLGHHAPLVLASMVVVSLINFTTQRHLVLSLTGYMGLDLMLSWVAVNRDHDAANRPLGFLLLATLGAVILLIPVVLGAVRRSRAERPLAPED